MSQDITSKLIEDADRQYKASLDDEKLSGMRFLMAAGIKPGGLEICYLDQHVAEEFRKVSSIERRGIGVRIAEILLTSEYGVNLDDYFAKTGGGHEVIPEGWRDMIRERVQRAQADDRNRMEGPRDEGYPPHFGAVHNATPKEEKGLRQAPSYLVPSQEKGCLF